MDSGEVFDAGQVRTPTKRMKKIKLEMYDMDPAALDAFISAVQAAAAANATFAPLAAAITALGTRLLQYHTKRLASVNADALAVSAAAALIDDRPGMETAMTNFANAVEGMPGVTEADILAIHLKLRSAGAPIGIPAQVQGFVAKAGDGPGAIDLSGEPVHGAAAYIYECSTYDTPRTWTQIKLATKASYAGRRA